MEREQALAAVKEKISNPNLIKHMLATEAVMRALAERFGQVIDEWGLAGLLHDIDLDECKGDMSVHGRLSAEMAREMDVSDEVCHAILCHGLLGEPCISLMDKALYCADPVTGLITAGALIRPEKKLSVVEAKSILKRFKEKSFAAGANREQIAKCSEIGLTLEEFITLSLKAMQGISDDLGL
ncbi:HD domain-containing protein [Dehalogenimonas etheniformans]|uniref:HDIG domain-containing protein n=1 Tax=Dehalogenimonas etheniformans TaxID=1536648 RepID=A0A2P5P9M1_9CHLR|nr:HD domain-containing protein [Dehalogenimonas etheniformans]PPD58987.1 HDIG domain-containing protein [Dehalogenimonas etheniformans]QNT76246.1 HDIG domain-containing protein [Dehalogenimonas etheniformans]